MRKSRLSGFADIDGCAGAGGQFLMAGNEVGVQMSFEDVANLQILFLRGFEIDLNIALRIDDDRFALGPEQVRGMGQTSQIKLFEVHRPPLRAT